MYNLKSYRHHTIQAQHGHELLIPPHHVIASNHIILPIGAASL